MKAQKAKRASKERAKSIAPIKTPSGFGFWVPEVGEADDWQAVAQLSLETKNKLEPVEATQRIISAQRAQAGSRASEGGFMLPDAFFEPMLALITDLIETPSMTRSGALKAIRAKLDELASGGHVAGMVAFQTWYVHSEDGRKASHLIPFLSRSIDPRVGEWLESLPR